MFMYNWEPMWSCGKNNGFVNMKIVGLNPNAPLPPFSSGWWT